MISTAVALEIIVGLALLVIVGAIVCWCARVTSGNGKSYLRFSRAEIVVGTVVCLSALAIAGATVILRT